MKRKFLSMALVICMAFALFPFPALRAAVTDSSAPYAYPSAYSGNPVADAGDTAIDVSKTKFGALPGNNAIGSNCVLYKGYYYVLSGIITRLPVNATDGTKFKVLYNEINDYMSSNLQIANDYIFWEERSSSGAGTVRIRRMKIDGTGLTTFARMEDKFTIYNGKIYVRDPNLDKCFPVEIVSYNLDGSGRKVLFTPPSGKDLALVDPGNDVTRLLEYSGGYCPFGFSGDKLYYVLQTSGYSTNAPELWSMNLDGSGKERVVTLPVKGQVGFRMVYNNYLYYTTGSTYRIPLSGGAAEQVLPDDKSFNLFGNKMFLPRITYPGYLSNDPTLPGGRYPVSPIFVADLDGKNMRSLFSTDYYPSIVNIVSPDYLFAEAHGTRGTFFSVNPSIKNDIRMDLGKFDAKNNVMIDPMKVSVKEAMFVEKGNVPDGWYYLRCMYNYLSINANGEAEFNDAQPYQKFKLTHKGGGSYRIETEGGKVLNVASPDNIGGGNRVIAQNTIPFDWLVKKETDELYSLNPLIAFRKLMNASEHKNTNGTHIIVWDSAVAPENARWRLILASPINKDVDKKTSYIDAVQTNRLSGADRFETAAAISKDGWQQSENIVLVNGYNFPCALAGSSFAYLKESPVLLTNTEKLNSTTANEINRLGAKNVYILGNKDEVSLEVENELKTKYNVVRIEGTDLFNTAVKIGEEVRRIRSFDTVALATQNDFPDALAITPFSAKNTMPILFSEKDKLRSDTKTALGAWGIKNVIISGGTGVISQAVEKELKDMGIKVTRLSGEDRYDTALAIVKHFENNKYTAAALATGLNYPDALTGAVLSAKKGVPLLLVEQNSVKQSVIDYSNTHKFEKAYVFGGESVISSNITGK